MTRIRNNQLFLWAFDDSLSFPSPWDVLFQAQYTNQQPKSTAYIYLIRRCLCRDFASFLVEKWQHYWCSAVFVLLFRHQDEGRPGHKSAQTHWQSTFFSSPGGIRFWQYELLARHVTIQRRQQPKRLLVSRWVLPNKWKFEGWRWLKWFGNDCRIPWISYDP